MEEPHEERANELEKQADVLEDHGETVGDMVDGQREDWDQKLSESGPPGAATREAAAPGGLGEEDEDEDGSEDASGDDADSDDEDSD
jgi:hypothetical protein